MDDATPTNGRRSHRLGRARTESSGLARILTPRRVAAPAQPAVGVPPAVRGRWRLGEIPRAQNGYGRGMANVTELLASVFDGQPRLTADEIYRRVVAASPP